jgi:hypothetical protein
MITECPCRIGGWLENRLYDGHGRIRGWVEKSFWHDGMGPEKDLSDFDSRHFQVAVMRKLGVN